MESNKLLDSLHRLFRSLESCENIVAMMEAIRTELELTLGFNQFWFHQLTEDKSSLSLVQATGGRMGLAEQGTQFPIDGDLFLKELVSSAGPVIVEDSRIDPRTNKEIVQALGLSTMVGIPTRMNGERTGFFGTGSSFDQSVRRLSVAECDYLQVIANHVALILDRRRIIDEFQETRTILFEKECNLQIARELGFIGIWELDLLDIKHDFMPPDILGFNESPSVGHGQNTVQAWMQIVHADDRKRINNQFQRQLGNSSNRILLEYRTLSNNADEIWLRSEGILRRDESGKAVRLIGCHVDITARKNSENNAATHEARLKHFVANAAIGIAMFDREMYCLAASELWTKGIAGEPSDRAGLNHFDVYPDLPERWKSINQRAMAGESLRNDCEHWQRADGSTVWVSWAVRPWRNDSGDIGGIIISAEDITHHKQMELQSIEIATSTQQSIGQDLHDTVSQELTALSILTRVMKDSLKSDPENVAQLVQQIESGVKRSMAQLRDIMQGLVPLNIDPGDMVPKLAELAERTQRIGAKKCTLNHPSGPVILPDSFTASQLYLIVQEAVHNAMKHPGTRNIEITLRTEPDFEILIKNDCDHPTVELLHRHHGLGRQIMQNRAALIGAKLLFENLEPNGMQVTCCLERRVHEF